MSNSQNSKLSMLNLGCGNRFHRDWVNVDFISTDGHVKSFNLRDGIPFPEKTFDCVYHSHLLEHFNKQDAISFISECFRVLRNGGVVRVVVPDLEAIAKIYLESLHHAELGNAKWQHNHEWMLLEMYDQFSRNRSGGEMAAYLSRKHLENEEFVFKRFGVEAINIRKAFLERCENGCSTASKDVSRPFLSVRSLVRKIRSFSPDLRELLLKKLLASEYEALLVGRFRFSGEVHQCMYDRYSLRTLLQTCGFSDVAIRSASESLIPDWPSYNLDTEPDGSVYKPDSLYMEAVKR